MRRERQTDWGRGEGEAGRISEGKQHGAQVMEWDCRDRKAGADVSCRL